MISISQFSKYFWLRSAESNIIRSNVDDKALYVADRLQKVDHKSHSIFKGFEVTITVQTLYRILTEMHIFYNVTGNFVH